MAPAVYEPTGRRLLRQVALAQVHGRAPSVVAGVVRDGALAWSGGYGDVPGPVRTTRYRIGSITKTVTAVLVLRLVVEGRLDLDRPIGEVLDDLTDGRSARLGGATIRSLLAHHSGVPAEPDGPWWERSPGSDWATLARTHADVAHAFPPGERFHYSNLGYALLGEAVARVRGAGWWECAQREVLAPLGMTSTALDAGEGPAARGYSVHPYTGVLTPEPATDTGAMAPAGQLWSTIDDLARWATFLLDGHPDVLGAAELARAAVPQVGAPESGLASGHGLGFQLQATGSGVLVGHGGSMPGFLAACFVDRTRGIGAVVLANATSGLRASRLAHALIEELDAAEPTLPPPWRPSVDVPAEVSDLLGLWHWGNTPLMFSWESDEVLVRGAGEVVHRFALRDGELWGTAGYHAGERLHAVRDADGSLMHVEASTFVYTRTPYQPGAPIPGGHPEDTGD